MLTKSLGSVSNTALPTANDVIINWADFAKNALEGENAESSMVCWSGHYEQFGRLMYQMIDVILRKEDYLKAKRFTKEQLDFFPELSTAQFLVEGANGTEDRTYFRGWFDLIGHKDFKGVDVDMMEPRTFAYRKYIMTLLATDLGYAITNRDAGEAEYLHCK